MGVKFNPFTSKLDIVDSPSGEFSDIELALGTQTAPSLSFTGDPNTGIYSPGADQLAISTGGTGRLFVNANGYIGAGTNTPTTPLNVYNGSTGLLLNLVSGQNNAGIQFANSGTTDTIQIISRNNDLEFRTDLGSYKWKTNNAASDAMVIDSSGRLLVGTSSSRNNFYGSLNQDPRLQVEGVGYLASTASVICNSDTANNSAILALSRTRGNALGSNTVVINNDTIGSFYFLGNDGSSFRVGASITSAVDGTPGANIMPGRLVFNTTSTTPGAIPTERMRIKSNGAICLGTTTEGTMSGDAVVAIGPNNGIISKSASGVATNGTVDITINTTGGGYQGFLIVSNTNSSNAAVRTHTTFSVFGRGTDSSIQQIATDNGSTGGLSFTVTTPSNGVIRVTNTSASTSIVNIQFFGGTSG